MRSLFIVIFLMIIALGLPSFAQSQGSGTPIPTPTPRPVTLDEVNRVSRNLYCPVCENVPLDVCPTEACARWRDQVRELLAQGYTDKEVERYFADRFGARAVGTPLDEATRFQTVVLPYALIGLFGAGVAVMLYRWRRAQRQVEAGDVSTGQDHREDDPGKTDDYRTQLEDELKKRF